MISIRKLFTFHAFVLVLIAFVPPESFAQKKEIVGAESCRDAEGGANPACRTKAGGRDERAGAGDEAEERQQRDQSKACMRKCQRGSEVEKKSCQKRCVR